MCFKQRSRLAVHKKQVHEVNDNAVVNQAFENHIPMQNKHSFFGQDNHAYGELVDHGTEANAMKESLELNQKSSNLQQAINFGMDFNQIGEKERSDYDFDFGMQPNVDLNN